MSRQEIENCSLISSCPLLNLEGASLRLSERYYSIYAVHIATYWQLPIQFYGKLRKTPQFALLLQGWAPELTETPRGALVTEFNEKMSGACPLFHALVRFLFSWNLMRMHAQGVKFPFFCSFEFHIMPFDASH